MVSSASFRYLFLAPGAGRRQPRAWTTAGGPGRGSLAGRQGLGPRHLARHTEAYDRGDKFAHYRRLSSLREYLLVSQKEPRLELYRKNEQGQWVLFEAAAGQSLVLASLPDVTLATDEIYRNPLANDG